MHRAERARSADCMPTGIEGLDRILGGGLTRRRVYLVDGEPGAGKTTFALQCLLANRERGERGLVIALSETEEELRHVAGSHGWSLDGIAVADLQSARDVSETDAQYTMFHPAEIELGEISRSIVQAFEEAKPSLIVIDSLSEVRLLARDPLRYRRQLLALKRHIAEAGATLLLLDYHDDDQEYPLETLVHGVIRLAHHAPDYGSERRRLRVHKMRGTPISGGFHDFRVETGGIVVYPRLAIADGVRVGAEALSSGIHELDALLGGGLPPGTSTMFIGPAGVGKSSLSAQYAAQAVARGDCVRVYSFDEAPEYWLARAEAMSIGMEKACADGLATIKSVNPAELTPGELAQDAVDAIEKQGVKLIVIDSLNGYFTAMPDDRYLTLHLHELLAYVSRRGVHAIIPLAQHGMFGETVSSPLDLSYLADVVLVLRYFEAFGRVRQAINVVKNRLRRHERAVRELMLTPEGIRIGEELDEFSGILSGQLSYGGERAPLMDRG